MTDEADPRPKQEPSPLPRLHPLVFAAGVGALWGAIGYAILWGHSPLVVSRAFVVSLPGTLALLPVRTVLAAFRLVEEWAGRSFHFPDSNWWIGVAAGAVGATIVAGVTALVRAAIARLRA